MNGFNFSNQRGSFLLSVIVVCVVIAGAASAILTVSTAHCAEQRGVIAGARALFIAESGISDALANVAMNLAPFESVSLGSESSPIRFGGGSYHVTATDNDDGTVTLLCVGSCEQQSVAVEVWCAVNPASLADFVIFSGNSSGATANALDLGGASASRDEVSGDVYVNGDINLLGDSVLSGDASATGVITGNPVIGTEEEGASSIPAPDLQAMNYPQLAEFKIDDNTPFDPDGELPAGDPRHIFVKEFRSDLGTTAGFHFDNTNYFLGDPHENADLSAVSVSPDGNNKTYFVDGNLWIEPNGATSQIVGGPAEGTVITVVVRGNIYFSDDFSYEHPGLDGVLFVALTDGESYVDMDGDNQYDSGEPLLHDDGDGVYEGPSEGSGNIHFGDPNGGPLGDIDGFLYAENSFDDHVLDGDTGEPLPFGVNGFLSAGEQVRVKRDLGGVHAQMVVSHDRRTVEGLLSLPGFPGGGGGGPQGVRVLSWRIVAAP